MNWIVKKHNILTHILLAYFTCGIWLIVYFVCKSTTDSSNNKEKIYDEYENEYFTSDTKLNDFRKINNQYKKILDKHYKNIENINMLYTVANNLALPKSEQMQQVIDLCLEDIKLAPQILNYCKEIANNFNDDLENHLINYVSFQRLAIIYEKQGEYQKAIDICKYAIKLGYYKDGTTGQMPGRLARLIKKARSKNISIHE